MQLNSLVWVFPLHGQEEAWTGQIPKRHNVRYASTSSTLGLCVRPPKPLLFLAPQLRDLIHEMVHDPDRSSTFR